MYVRVCVYIVVSMYVRVYSCKYVCACVCVYIVVSMYVCVCVCVCARVQRRMVNLNVLQRCTLSVYTLFLLPTTALAKIGGNKQRADDCNASKVLRNHFNRKRLTLTIP